MHIKRINVLICTRILNIYYYAHEAISYIKVLNRFCTVEAFIQLVIAGYWFSISFNTNF